MIVVYDVFVLLCDLLQLVAIVTLVFGNKFTKSKGKQIIFIVSSFLIYLISYLVYIEAFYMLRNMIICILCVYCLFEYKLLKAILCGFILFWIDSFCEGMILAVLEERLNIGGKGREIISVIVGTSLVLALVLIFKKITKRFIDIDRNRWFSIFVCVLIGYMLYLLAYPYYKTTELHTIKYLVIAVCWGVTIVFLGGLFIYLVNQNSELKISQRVNEEKNKLMHNYYEQLEERDVEIRKFRHDYKNHVRGIIYYVEEEKYDELKKYVETIQTEGILRSTMIDVGHDYINAIFNHYYLECKEEGITFKVEGNICGAESIEDYDWSVIIPNMLDNAIEATKKISDKEMRKIVVNLKNVKNKIVISETNPVCKDVSLKVLEKIQTTKIDKLNHGYGIKNIKNSVEKYHGDLTCEIDENNQFVMTIWMQSDRLS